MRGFFAVAVLASAVAGCGASSEPVRVTAPACEVRLPTADERAAGARLARKYEALQRKAESALRRLRARDDGSRPVAADALAKAQEQRRAEGLDASPEATRAVIVARLGYEEEMGLPLTPAEFDLLYARGDIGNHTKLMQKYARTCLRDAYGGLYYGGDSRGQYLALPLTTGSASARRELVRRSAISAAFLRTPRVRFTLTELTAAKERISDELQDEPDFSSVGVSQSENRVNLRIEPFTDARAAELRERYGAVLHVSRGSRPVVL
ncbi:hypothetical protein OJ998_27955 [Solirubrobacter taibaiensis]|nr:hypothetical protein [Solirubrobacter taibaiensis]